MERGSYLLKTGVATITLFEIDPLRREAVDKPLHPIYGLQGIAVVVKPADPGKLGAMSRFLGITGEGEAFPTGDFFHPLIADPKQPQFFVSLNSFRSSGLRYTMASVGFGETFGLYRLLGSHAEDGLQLSLEGAIFAQFKHEHPFLRSCECGLHDLYSHNSPAWRPGMGQMARMRWR